MSDLSGKVWKVAGLGGGIADRKSFILLVAGNASFAHADSRVQTLVLGNKRLQVEVVESEEERAKGLMFRKSMPSQHGMLFVFESESRLSFWMKNTFIPLSIGFFDKDKRLVDIQDMEPMRSEMQSEFPSYVSRRPAKYALEVNRGWFQRNGIKEGAAFRLENSKTKGP